MKKIYGSTVGMGLPKPDLNQKDPTKGNYVHGKESVLPQPRNGAQPGMFIAVADVDANGVVTATEAVEAPSGGGPLPFAIVSDIPANHVVVMVDGIEFTTECIEEVEENVDG